MKLTNKQLQAELNKLATAQNKVQQSMNRICEHCQEVYGVEPGDIDNDWFTDSVGGGCGGTTGMSVKDFEDSMRMFMK